MKNLNHIKYNEDWKVWVSTDGHIYRMRKDNHLVEYSRSITNSGYYQIGVTKAGKPFARLVHRLVAETFLDNSKNYRDVDHINNDKLDNRLENLRWCTHGFNTSAVRRVLKDEHKVALVIGAIDAHLGKKWYTDGVRNVVGNPGECPEGFHPGFTKSKKGQGHYNIKPAREWSHEEKIA